MTFAERKKFASYKRVAVLVPDQDIGFTRVAAYHSNVEDAKETIVRSRKYTRGLERAEIYVRHDEPPEPIAGDYQI